MSEALWAELASNITFAEPEPVKAAFHRLLERVSAAPAGLEPTSRFVQRVGAIVRDAPDVSAALDALHAEDLLLACACADGDTAALAAFERQQLAPLRTVLRGIGLDSDGADEVLQQMRHWLWIGDERGPRIADYAGRGSLRAWLKVIAVRTARRQRAQQPPVAEVGELPTGADVELDYLKHTYRSEFGVAFREAVAQLPVRERNLLRLHILDGLSIDQIGAIYHVHRSTAARQIESARTAIVEAVRARFAARIDIAQSELESVLQLIASRVDVSLRSVFRRSVTHK